jgi:hypothetical protein
MEPRNEQRAAESARQTATEKKTRFQLVKLEERIAPSKGKHWTGGYAQVTCHCSKGGNG